MTRGTTRKAKIAVTLPQELVAAARSAVRRTGERVGVRQRGGRAAGEVGGPRRPARGDARGDRRTDDHGVREVQVLRQRATRREVPISVPAGVLGHDGRTQARLSRFLSANGLVIVPLDDRAARAAGQLCGATRTSDVIDASVVLCAHRRGDQVMTSDPDDLPRLDPDLALVVV